MKSRSLAPVLLVALVAAPDEGRSDARKPAAPSPASTLLPTNAARPFQTVVYFPGSSAQALPRLLEPELNFSDFVIRSGRAVLYPIYKNTYERRLKDVPSWPSRAYRDLEIQQAQDVWRSVDYLETRSDIDKDKLAYYGFSWGALRGELSQKPMFRFLGTKAEDKRLVLFDGGHIPGHLAPVKPVLECLTATSARSRATDARARISGRAASSCGSARREKRSSRGRWSGPGPSPDALPRPGTSRRRCDAFPSSPEAASSGLETRPRSKRTSASSTRSSSKRIRPEL